MKCISPLVIKNPSKDGFMRNLQPYLTVPCGKCFACLTNMRNQWIFRLKQELNACHTSAYFVTLTYDDPHQPFTSFSADGVSEVTLDKERVKRFLHDFRDARSQRPMKLRYFLVGEYGDDSGRPHYHMCLFNYQGDNVMLHDEMCKYWSEGGIQVLYLTGALIGYITKYMLKIYDDELNSGHQPDWQKPFRLMSQGLGKQWCTRNKLWYMVQNGYKQVLNDGDSHRKVPRYFLDRLAKQYAWDIEGSHFNIPSKAELDGAVKRLKRRFGQQAYKFSEQLMLNEHRRNVINGLDDTHLEYDRYFSAQRRALKLEEQKRINKKFNQKPGL